MNRIPLLPTLIVFVAIVIMIWLGIWQLQRADEKAFLLARYAIAAKLPEIAFPAMPTNERLLFRRHTKKLFAKYMLCMKWLSFKKSL